MQWVQVFVYGNIVDFKLQFFEIYVMYDFFIKILDNYFDNDLKMVYNVLKYNMEDYREK